MPSSLPCAPGRALAKKGNLVCLKSVEKAFGRRCRSVQPWTCRAGGLLHKEPRATATLAEKLKKIVEAESAEEVDEEFDEADAPDDPDALTTQQVHTLLNVVCQETDVAEVELQIGDFGLRVRRRVADTATPSSEAVDSNGAGGAVGPAIELPFQSTTSMDETQIPAQQSNGHLSSSDEEDWEENLIFLGAPKVGILRRGRYAKGKRVGKGVLVEVGAKVKKGQLLAFIEQLGTHVPVQAPQAGEIVAIHIEEGSPVEYKEVIIEIAPFFGGHIIGDRKYA